jgi:solute carrier family 13 (sodium-dependent dicarboxylate transporter), member 2/3/5
MDLAPASPVERVSAVEARVERARRTAGFVLAPLMFIGLLAAPLGLAAPAHRLAAILAAVVVLWVCESLPLAITAILGPILAVVLQVAPARQVFASFADPVVFVFIGGFMLAEAMFVHRLDRRIAFAALASRFVGSSAARALVVYGAVTTFISAWISNVATTAMMYPIGLAMAAHVVGSGERDPMGQPPAPAGERLPDAPPAVEPATSEHPAGRSPGARRFALGMMLITAFGASVGGLATPVGTPPNLIGMGLIERVGGHRISFLQWVAIGLPAAVILFAVVAALFVWTCGRGLQLSSGGRAVVAAELARLGRLTAGERNVLIAFGVTVLLWIAPGLLAAVGQSESAFARGLQASVPESVAAMLGATLLFLLPIDWRKRQFTLTWDQASHIEWGIVLLYGGGLALGDLAFTTGLARAMGEGLTSWGPAPTTFGLTVLFTAVAIILSETTSNTASANMIVPVAIAVAKSAGIDPLAPALAATLGASMGFMMPISTPPNAIVYGSGHVPLTAMMRFGVVLDVAGFVVIVALVTWLVPLVFG